VLRRLYLAGARVQDGCWKVRGSALRQLLDHPALDGVVCIIC